jgi:Uncharacterised protein family (UPF0158)
MEKRHLKVKLDDFTSALIFSVEAGDGGWYLDMQTGDIFLDADGAEDLPEDLADNPRYRLIDPIASHESFQVMEEFVATVEDSRAAKRLTSALEGRKPFRAFKDALFDFPALREAWFAFESDAQRRYADAWCEANDIDPQWI